MDIYTYIYVCVCVYNYILLMHADGNKQVTSFSAGYFESFV